MHDYICLGSPRTGWSSAGVVPVVGTRKCIWWIHSLCKRDQMRSTPLKPFVLLGQIPAAFLENNLNWFQSKNTFLFSGLFKNCFSFCSPPSSSSFISFSFCQSTSAAGLNGIGWDWIALSIFVSFRFFLLWLRFSRFVVFGFWEKGTHAFGVKIAFKRNQIWLYNNASACAPSVHPSVCVSVRPAACMSVSVAVFHLSQHIQSVKRQASRDGGQGTRRSVRYNTGLWDFVVRCCCCCCYCISYVDMAARSSTSQRLFVVGFVGILFSPSLSFAPSPCAAFGVRVLSFFFVFWLDWKSRKSG